MHTVTTHKLAAALRAWVKQHFSTEIKSSDAHKAIAEMLGQRNQHTLAAKGRVVSISDLSRPTQHSPFVQWIAAAITRGESTSAIADNLNNGAALSEIGYLPTTADFIDAIRASLETGTATPIITEEQVPTSIALFDGKGVPIEAKTFSDSGDAAEWLAQFVRTSTDSDWIKQGIPQPAPSSYTIEIQFRSDKAHDIHPPIRASRKNPPDWVGEIIPWHVQDHSDEHLSPMQKKPWPIRISRNGWGLTLDAERPDGSQIGIAIEVDMGNLALHIASDSNRDNDLSVKITQDAAYAIPIFGDHPAYRFSQPTEDAPFGVKVVMAEVPISFAQAEQKELQDDLSPIEPGRITLPFPVTYRHPFQGPLVGQLVEIDPARGNPYAVQLENSDQTIWVRRHHFQLRKPT